VPPSRTPISLYSRLVFRPGEPVAPLPQAHTASRSGCYKNSLNSFFWATGEGQRAVCLPALDAEDFDRARDGLLQFFSREQAETLIQYRGDRALPTQMDELAQRNTEED
jgi:hypothetical protein